MLIHVISFNLSFLIKQIFPQRIVSRFLIQPIFPDTKQHPFKTKLLTSYILHRIAITSALQCPSRGLLPKVL